MTSEKLNHAIRLIKSGSKQTALPLLKEIVQANPNDENAWLWLHVCVDKVEQKKYCLQKALEINPGNQHAQQALSALTGQTPQPTQPVSSTEAPPPQPASKSKPSPQGDKHPWLFTWGLGAGFVLFSCIVLVFILYLAQTGQIRSLAANPSLLLASSITPSPSATQSLSPTATITPSPSLVPTTTRTATFRPSRTLTPLLETLTPTPTLNPFTPGAPTATPLGSDITDPNFIKGVAAFQADNNEEVIHLMGSVIEANPELAPPYRYRGLAYWSLNDCGAALADEEKALAINSDYAAAWAALGLIHGCLGNESRALRDYQKALALDPSLAMVHDNLGVYYYGIGNYEKSLEEYSLSVEIDPTRSGSWSGKSEALARLGHYEECITNASKALQVNRKEWLAYTDRADCETAQENYMGAINDYTVYITNYPIIATGSYYLGAAYEHRGDAYYNLRKYYQAIADYQKELTFIPRSAHAYCQISYSYFTLKKYQNALEAAKASIAINPACGGQKLVEVESRASYALGNYDQAIDYMNQALAMGPYPLGYYYRGISFQAAGRPEEAIQDLEQFLATDYDYNQEEVEDAQARLAKLKP